MAGRNKQSTLSQGFTHCLCSQPSTAAVVILVFLQSVRFTRGREIASNETLGTGRPCHAGSGHSACDHEKTMSEGYELRAGMCTGAAHSRPYDRAAEMDTYDGRLKEKRRPTPSIVNSVVS